MFKNVPEEQQWAQVKAAVQEKLPPKVNLWQVSQVNDKHAPQSWLSDVVLICFHRFS